MRRWYVRALVGLLVVGLLVWGWGQWNNQARLANALESSYQRDFYTVIEQTEQLEALLSKGLVSGSPRQQVFLLTEIWSRANMAQGALGQLPFTELNLSASRKFLAQMGDYAYSLARRVARGDALEKEHREQLQSFYREVREYGSVLKRTERDLHGSGYRWATALGKPGLKMRAARKPQVKDGKGLNGIKEMDQRFDGLPLLVYDGPFSDQATGASPKGLMDKNEEITQKEAENKAEQFVNQGLDGDYQAIRSNRVEGSIPAYGVTLDGQGRPGLVTVDVSIKGGQVLTFLNSRPAKKAVIGGQEAEQKAQAFLAEKGFKDLEKTYAVNGNNARWIVFAAKEEGVRLYPDQIKVQVALDDGEIIGFDAMMYLMHHHSRKLPEPKFSQEEAEKKLSSDLAVKSRRLALIPLAGGREVLTYEFLAAYEGEDYLIYINALTGEEENLLKLVPASQGELAI